MTKKMSRFLARISMIDGEKVVVKFWKQKTITEFVLPIIDEMSTHDMDELIYIRKQPVVDIKRGIRALF